MSVPKRPTQLDSKSIFQAYAVVAALAGIAVMLLNFRTVGALFGGMLMAAACASLAVANVADGEARRQAGGWFAMGHAIMVLAMFTIGQFDSHGGTIVVNLLVGVCFLFYYVWRGSDDVQVRPRPLQSLFSKPDHATERLRSRYEESIRLAASQEERHRLARDLHDSVKQQLFVIQTAAATAQARFEADATGAREAIDHVRAAAREAIAEMQAMLAQLRAEPLENTGLAATLQKQCEALGFRTGAAVHLEIGQLPPNETITPGTQEALFRTAQEALSNIARHARAQTVWVSLTAAGGQLALRIRDDGSGFDTNREFPGMGVPNMRARALEFGGVFELTSSRGEGTTITVTVPYLELFPESYGRKAAAWGLALLATAALMAVYPAVTATWIAVMVALEFARHFVAWRRTRKVAV